jgi:hypothetical protein
MSEGPPKKPEKVLSPEEMEESEPVDPTTTIIAINRFFMWVSTKVSEKKLSLPGPAARSMNALASAQLNMIHLGKMGESVGPAYLHYVSALKAVINDDNFWNVLAAEPTSGDQSSTRELLQTYADELDSVAIQQFPFTGRMQ